MAGTEDRIGLAAFGWWKSALDDRGAGRMARAQLRRCDTAAEALAIDATHHLHKVLGGDMTMRGETLALVAIALANLRLDDSASVAKRFGDGPAVSAIRFQALIRVVEPAELIRPLRRALAQIGSAGNVRKLAVDLYRWEEPTRNQWCFAYYGAELNAPTDAEEIEE